MLPTMMRSRLPTAAARAWLAGLSLGPDIVRAARRATSVAGYPALQDVK